MEITSLLYIPVHPFTVHFTSVGGAEDEIKTDYTTVARTCNFSAFLCSALNPRFIIRKILRVDDICVSPQSPGSLNDIVRHGLAF